MRRHVLWYGLAAGLLIVLLRLVEYRWLVLTHSFEIYGALLAIIFAAVGIWVGLRLTTPKVVVEERIELREVPGTVTQAPAADFSRDDNQVAALGVTPRELEILGLLAEGLSNREIAERLFVSENTVKTHASRLFDKLEVRRRTQAVQRGQQLRLIP
ncbi:helix-turn-helix transcriptional regulator [Gemmatimonas sp. UBA7669]|uniref:helix-turn-helix transcriptional regulator n=1 Tax=Gemmatimonas sp. UBA7669 TaxID=1946568 RepID=UPI0025C3FC8F|nr:response regulator transcription factor [Gemmatimonas sp. UBA7669]